MSGDPVGDPAGEGDRFPQASFADVDGGDARPLLTSASKTSWPMPSPPPVTTKTLLLMITQLLQILGGLSAVLQGLLAQELDRPCAMDSHLGPLNRVLRGLAIHCAMSIVPRT